jgi:hypothetical protein
VVDHRGHPGKQLRVIAVAGRDNSFGQHATREAADTVQDHAATSSDPECLDDEARGGVGIDLAGRAEPDVDWRAPPSRKTSSACERDRSSGGVM